ncbi:unnamed protein product [Dovyalis caffra]|uniref:Carboxypeptidase n=1 Tax=Dovyalis caffra TaxID=77055 RepID=A0AAV1RIT1_9ROSI|nr:unnamed protein product [Dovyalis caffra]
MSIDIRIAMVNLCLLIVFLLQVLFQVVVSHSTVKFLPGFHGPLPFHLETGYVGVGEQEDVQLFYYFMKSQGNAEEDPLLLWLTGGPGCSAFSGLVFETGPIHFEMKEYNGSLPTFVLNPYSWTQVASIIYIDMPVGTGFSYARTPLASQRGDFEQVSQGAQFLRKWLMDHQEFLSNPVYVVGESYTGLIIPAMVQMISEGNDEGIKPPINIKGYVLGNPVTNSTFDLNSKIPYAHGMGLISDELYESLKKSCGGEYQKIDSSNVECLKNVEAFDKCISGIKESHILEPKCIYVSPRPVEMFGRRRSLNENPLEFLHLELDFPDTIGCRDYGFVLASYWANDNNVRKALHIREGSIGTWHRCNYKSYKNQIKSSIKYHIDLGNKGYRRLIYSGDHDMRIPFLGTQAWIRSLNYSLIDDWRPWHFQGQVAGYTRTYSNQLVFATVKGGGHTAPEFRPAECLAMLKRWLIQETL